MVAVIIAGSDIPQFYSRVHIGKLSKMSVRVSVGPVSMTTQRRASDGGEVVWGEVLKHERLTLPRDTAEIPDIFIYIVDRDDRCASLFCLFT